MNMADPDSLRKALMGEPVGTLVTTE